MPDSPRDTEAVRFDPFAPAYTADPYTVFARLRQEAPAF